MNRVFHDYPEISLKPEQLDGLIDFERLFGRPGPVHIEIGSGKGTFLLSEAQSQKETNFLGIEWANKYYRAAVDRLGRWNIENVRLIRTDVAVFLPEHVPDESIDWFHIYFPDPWPKARHNKRRFISEKNMPQLLRCLKPAGRIQMATDHQDYFEQMQEVVRIFIEKQLIREVEFIRPAGAQDGEIVGTNYERKYIKEGRTFNKIAVEKV